MPSDSPVDSVTRNRLLLAVRALAGLTLAFALASCGDSERDNDDADTPRGGTGGTGGTPASGGGPASTGGGPSGTGGAAGSSGGGSSTGGTPGTGGYYNPCASFVITYNTVCAPPGHHGFGGTGGSGGTSAEGGATGEGGSAGMPPTIEECRANPPYCPLPTPGVVSGVTVRDGLCCVDCQTICG